MRETLDIIVITLLKKLQRLLFDYNNNKLTTLFVLNNSVCCCRWSDLSFVLIEVTCSVRETRKEQVRQRERWVKIDSQQEWGKIRKAKRKKDEITIEFPREWHKSQPMKEMKKKKNSQRCNNLVFCSRCTWIPLCTWSLQLLSQPLLFTIGMDPLRCVCAQCV